MVYELERTSPIMPDGARKQFCQAKLDTEKKRACAIVDVGRRKIWRRRRCGCARFRCRADFPRTPTSLRSSLRIKSPCRRWSRNAKRTRRVRRRKRVRRVCRARRRCRACHASHRVLVEALVQLPGKDKPAETSRAPKVTCMRGKRSSSTPRTRSRLRRLSQRRLQRALGGAANERRRQYASRRRAVRSCHGAGSTHAKTGDKADIVGKPDEARCRFGVITCRIFRPPKASCSTSA